MFQFTYQDPRFALYDLSRRIMDTGDSVAPRGIPTREWRHVTLQFRDVYTCLPIGMGRNFNPKLAAVEALSLIGGFAHSEMLTAASPNFNSFTGGSPTGAYGPRLARQLPVIVDMLRQDPDTRQAVAMIWSPETDLFAEHGDRPCTTEVHFMIRDGLLLTTTYMRSQDIYLGFTYDAPMFVMLHLTIANVLGVAAGPWTHNVHSLHAYERDYDKIARLSNPPLPSSEAITRLYGLDGPSWHEVAARARELAYDDVSDHHSHTERWLSQQMYHVRAKMIELAR